MGVRKENSVEYLVRSDLSTSLKRVSPGLNLFRSELGLKFAFRRSRLGWVNEGSLRSTNRLNSSQESKEAVWSQSGKLAAQVGKPVWAWQAATMMSRSVVLKLTEWKTPWLPWSSMLMPLAFWAMAKLGELESSWIPERPARSARRTEGLLLAQLRFTGARPAILPRDSRSKSGA
jgi:hypothetical protein